jgi:hypothetical protein
MQIEVTSYTELMTGIQSHVEALGLRLVDFDDLAGFPAGLSGKVFGMLQVKRLGPEKMFDALRAAGLRLRLEIDPEQRARMQNRISENYNPRQANQARPKHSATKASTSVLSRILKPFAKDGGKARWANKSAKERSEHARMMAMAGVKKRRREMKRRARQRTAAHKARKISKQNNNTGG